MRTLRSATAADLSRVVSFWEGLYARDAAFVTLPWAWRTRGLAAAIAQADRFRLLLVEDDGVLVATASAQRDRTTEVDPARPVWVGAFEAVDASAAALVLEGVRRVATTWGAGSLRGPRGLGRFDQVGLTVEGFDRLPPMLQGHHPPHYADWLHEAGFRPHHDLLAYETPLVTPAGGPRPLPSRLAEKVDKCAIPGLRFRAGSRVRFRRDAVVAHEVLNAAYATVPDVQPMKQGAFVQMLLGMTAVAPASLFQLGFVGDRPVAFAVCMPELNEALAPSRGRMLPLGWARTVSALARGKTAAFKLIGVLPEFRGTGLHAALIRAVVRGAQAAGYTRMEGSIIDQRNKPMRGVVEGIGMTVYRRYRQFALPLDAAPTGS